MGTTGRDDREGARDGAGRPAVGAVLLAAGAATRFGGPKQLAPYAGAPLVRRAAAAALAAGARPVVVVLGAHADAVRPALEGLAGVAAVTHAAWAEGLASSLAAGVRALLDAAPCDGVLLTLADQPLVDAAALRSLLDRFDEAHRVVAAAYAGTVGAPAVIGREHLADLLATLAGDAGAGRWLRARLPLVTRVPLPAAALDVDTAEDAARLPPAG